MRWLSHPWCWRMILLFAGLGQCSGVMSGLSLGGLLSWGQSAAECQSATLIQGKKHLMTGVSCLASQDRKLGRILSYFYRNLRCNEHCVLQCWVNNFLCLLRVRCCGAGQWPRNIVVVEREERDLIVNNNKINDVNLQYIVSHYHKVAFICFPVEQWNTCWVFKLDKTYQIVSGSNMKVYNAIYLAQIVLLQHVQGWAW